MILLLFTITLFVSGIIIAGGITDFLKLKIPNILPVMIIIGFAVAYPLHTSIGTNAGFQELSSHLVAFGIMLIIMAGLFFANLFGGGDAKLIPAVALWTGIQGLAIFLMITSIIGGLLGLASIGLRKTGTGRKIIERLSGYKLIENGWVGALAKDNNVIPYGIAIAIGGIGAFRSLGFLP